MAPNSATKTSSLLNFDGLQAQALNPDGLSIARVEVQYQYISATSGRLETLPAIDVSNDIFVSIATRQQEEPLALDQYILNSGSGLQPFLSKSINRFEIGASDLGQLSFYAEFIGVNTYTLRVRSKDASGAILQTGYLDINTNNIDFEQVTVATGTKQIQNFVWSLGSVDLSLNNVRAYDITLGFIVFVPISETKEFRIKPCGKDKARVHWLNPLGGFDSYNFNSVHSVNSEKDLASRPLPFAFAPPQRTIESKGTFVLSSKASTSIRLTTQGDKKLASWLASLSYSAEVYIESENGFLAATINDSTQITIDKGIIQIEFEAILANDIISHRN